MDLKLQCLEAICYYCMAFQRMTSKGNLMKILKDDICPNMEISQKVFKQVQSNMEKVDLAPRIMSHLELRYAIIQGAGLPDDVRIRNCILIANLLEDEFEVKTDSWLALSNDLTLVMDEKTDLSFKLAKLESIKQSTGLKDLSIYNRSQYQTFVPLLQAIKAYVSDFKRFKQQIHNASGSNSTASPPQNDLLFSGALHFLQSIADWSTDDCNQKDFFYNVLFLIESEGTNECTTSQMPKLLQSLYVRPPESSLFASKLCAPTFNHLWKSLASFHQYTDARLLKQHVRLYLEISPIMLNLPLVPLKLPASGQVLAHFKVNILRKNKSDTIVERLRLISSLDLKTDLQKLEAIKKNYLEEIVRLAETYLPIFLEYIPKLDLWKELFEPEVLQYRAQCTLHLNNLSSSSGERKFDGDIIRAWNDVNLSNNAIYQVACTLLDPEMALQIPFVDLNDVAVDYLRDWFEKLEKFTREVVDRCLKSDTWQVEDNHLNTSSSVHDLFTYLHSVVDILFSLPFSGAYKDDCLLNGLWRTVSNYLKQFCDVICKGVWLYCKQIVSINADFTDAAFLTFAEARKRKGDSSSNGELIKERQGVEIFGMFRMLNDLILAKERLYDLIHGRIRSHLAERSTLFIVRICDECFEGVVHSTNELIIRFMDFVAKRLVRLELKTDLADNLYSTDKDISHSSVLLLLQTIRAVIHDIKEQICTDVIFKRNRTELLQESGNHATASDLMTFLFCVEFVKMYELIVFGDLFSARIFKRGDANIILDDLELMEVEFTQVNNQLLMGPKFKFMMWPIKTVVQTLYSMDTDNLVKTCEKLSSVFKSSQNPSPIGVAKKIPTKPTLNICLEDVIYRLKETEDYDIITSTASQNNYHPVCYLKHDYESLLAESPAPVQPTVWTSITLTHVIARRAGYSNPKYFPLDSSSMDKTNHLMQAFSDKVPDKSAFLYMKSYSVKHYFEKKVSKVFGAIRRRSEAH